MLEKKCQAQRFKQIKHYKLNKTLTRYQHVLKKSKKLNMKNIIKAIADFQQDCPVILKDTSGYGYKYADLTQIDSIIKPLLKKHGLAYVQPLQGENIQTILFHIESGEKIESNCNIPFNSIRYDPVIIETTKNGITEKKTKYIIAGFEGMNTAQAYGSLITYFRRYTISSLLGLITDKDTDGTGVQQPAPVQAPEVKQPDPKLTPEQLEKQRLITKWNAEKSLIGTDLNKCNSIDEVKNIWEKYINYQIIKDFKDMVNLAKDNFNA